MCRYLNCIYKIEPSLANVLIFKAVEMGRQSALHDLHFQIGHSCCVVRATSEIKQSLGGRWSFHGYRGTAHKTEILRIPGKQVAVIRECVIVITHHWNCSPTTFDVRKLVSHNKMNFGWRSDFVLLSYGSLGSTGFGTKFHNKETFSSYLIGCNFNIHLIVC